MSKNQFTGTATQPQRNRNVCQSNNDQYCILVFPMKWVKYRRANKVLTFAYHFLLGHAEEGCVPQLAREVAREAAHKNLVRLQPG